jgi:hypothetical protein
MIMPRLSFEEPKGGPLAKAAQDEQQDEQLDERPDEPSDERDAATELFEQFTDEPEEAPERRANRDTVVVVLRAATVAVAIALVGFIILLATAGEDEQPTSSPGVPKIPTSHEPAAGPTTPALGAIVDPPVHSQTTEIVPPPPPPVTQPTIPTDTPPSGPQSEFVHPGEPCDTPGAYAFTESFEPMVCDVGRHGQKLAWRRVFR